MTVGAAAISPCLGAILFFEYTGQASVWFLSVLSILIELPRVAGK